MNSDVIVIGGGLIGCGIAAELASRGLKVRLFERGQLIKEASWAAAGMLAPQSELEAITPLFLLCQKSLELYQNFVAKLYNSTKIDPCYRSEGALQLAFDEQGAKALEKKLSWQTQAGLKLEKLTPTQALKLAPALSSDLALAYYLPNEHQVDNRKLSHAIATYAEQSGVIFHLGTQVTEILCKRGKVVGIVANQETYHAAKVINAAGSWASLFNLPRPLLPEVSPVRGQMIALKTLVGYLQHTLHFGHTYLVPRWDGTIVVGSTTEHVGYNKQVTVSGLQHILSQAQRVIPKLAEATVAETWSGLRPATADLQPVLGEHELLEGLIFATGHYRNGILLAPVTIDLITELVITGQSQEIMLPFSPSRFVSTAKAG